MNRSFRAPERGQMGSLRLKDNKDEDLALFREMRKREKERNNLLLLQNSDEFDVPLGIWKFSILFYFILFKICVLSSVVLLRLNEG